ncbi:hypothetical protein Taro_020826 [Colocasia esculenta]|uniref:Uncharacterized protein n=1 Tax=Colocasia esculenta TaxID=4460 RepID=A0A843UPP4_COLES|nr:hypothetical protein [Colocasia esculenta]
MDSQKRGRSFKNTFFPRDPLLLDLFPTSSTFGNELGSAKRVYEVHQASLDEELLASSRPEGRKKVQPLFSRTVENAADKGVTTGITCPGRAS